MYFLLELEHAPDGGKRHALVGKLRDVADDRHLGAGVTALAARRAGRPDHAELVQPAQERLLDLQHLGDLTDREQRQVLFLEREHGTTLQHWFGPGKRSAPPARPVRSTSA